jgi:undecaprenyl-diphosphatase
MRSARDARARRRRPKAGRPSMRSAGDALSPAQALALGLLQGPTELLPVSSSAHTALLAWLARWPYARLDGERRKAFEVALHAGAGVALALSMGRELIEDAALLDRRRVGAIALSLAPPALAGYALERPIQQRLGGPRSIAAGLLAGALAMALADAGAQAGQRASGGGRSVPDAGPRDGLALGVAQAGALIPGVSRNGATLAAARARGFSRRAADTLSWHVGLPTIFAAGALKGLRALRRELPREERVALALGATGAFLSTLASAAGRSRAPRALWPYSLYRCLLAALVLARLRERTPADRRR